MVKIIASLIAGNEEHIIVRCIENIIPFCNAIVLLCNGNDRTLELSIDYFKLVNYTNYLVFYDKWIGDFSYTRNKSLEAAEKYIMESEGFKYKVLNMKEFRKLKANPWYIFVKDIDDIVMNVPDLIKEIKTFSAISYWFDCKSETHGHMMRAFIKFSHSIKYRYTKKIHETLDNVTYNGNEYQRIFIKSSHLKINSEGERSKNRFKFLNDAKVLQEIVINNPYDDRSLFYLAQSYKDQRLPEQALIYYRKRYELEYGYQCERYLSLLYMYYFSPNMSFGEKVKLLMKAIEMIPQRFEAPTELMRIYIGKKMYMNALIYGLFWYNKPEPDGYLSVSLLDHIFYLPDLLAQCYSILGNQIEAKKIWGKMIKEGKIPEKYLSKIVSRINK